MKNYQYKQHYKNATGTQNWDVLDPVLAETICAANDAYIGELIGARGHGLQAHELPPSVLSALSGLDRRERRRIAAVPYTLFSLRFSDANFWRDLIERPLSACRRVPGGEGFGRTAVFLAWHLVQAGYGTAGVALGMSSEVATLYQWLPLCDLDRIGAMAQPGMAPRWPTNMSFWRRLLASARDGSAIETARFFGLQLLAAECLPEDKLRTRAG